MSRRLFLKISAILASLAVLPQVVLANAAELIDLTGKKRTDAANNTALGIAKGLNYVEDVAKAAKEGKVKYPDKTGVKMADQLCSKCQFYKAADGKKGGVCTLIPGVLVHEGGGCMSWVKKA